MDHQERAAVLQGPIPVLESSAVEKEDLSISGAEAVGGERDDITPRRPAQEIST